MTKRILLQIMGLAMLVFSQSLLSEVVDIDNEQFRELMQRGVLVVDIRTPAEWKQTGVIEGSALMMFFDEKRQSDPEAWVSGLESLTTPDKEVILICRSGNRSKVVATFLSERKGYSKVYNVAKGILGWKAQGNPTVSPDIPSN